LQTRLIWVFNDEGEARLARKDEIKVEIELKQNKDGEQANIDHKDCTKAHRTFRVMVAPAANLEAEYKKLEKKGTDLSRHPT
jgi:hypothetical protein